MAPDGRARVEVFPKGDANDNAALSASPPRYGGRADATGDHGRHPGVGPHHRRRRFWRRALFAPVDRDPALGRARAGLRRAADAGSADLAGVLTLEICVLIGLPLNFANIIALPLLFGVGVAFKIYYVMAWRGRDEPAAVEPDAGGDLQRADDGDRVRQPVALGHPGTASMGELLALSLAPRWRLR